MPQACSVFNKTKKLFLRRGSDENDKLLGWSYGEGLKAYITKFFYLLSTEWKDDLVIVQGDQARLGDREFISTDELSNYKEKVLKQVPADFKIPRYFFMKRPHKGGQIQGFIDLNEIPELKVLLPFLIYNSNGRGGGDVNVYGDDMEIFEESFTLYTQVDLIVKNTIDFLLAFGIGSSVSLRGQKSKLSHPNDRMRDFTEMLSLLGFYVDADLKHTYPEKYLSILRTIQEAINKRQANLFNNLDLADLEEQEVEAGNIVRLKDIG